MVSHSYDAVNPQCRLDSLHMSQFPANIIFVLSIFILKLLWSIQPVQSETITCNDRQKWEDTGGWCYVAPDGLGFCYYYAHACHVRLLLN